MYSQTSTISSTRWKPNNRQTQSVLCNLEIQTEPEVVFQHHIAPQCSNTASQKIFAAEMRLEVSLFKRGNRALWHHNTRTSSDPLTAPLLSLHKRSKLNARSAQLRSNNFCCDIPMSASSPLRRWLACDRYGKEIINIVDMLCCCLFKHK